MPLVRNEQSLFDRQKCCLSCLKNKGKDAKNSRLPFFALLLVRLRTKEQNKDHNAEPSVFATVESVSQLDSLS